MPLSLGFVAVTVSRRTGSGGPPLLRLKRKPVFLSSKLDLTSALIFPSLDLTLLRKLALWWSLAALCAEWKFRVLHPYWNSPGHL